MEDLNNRQIVLLTMFTSFVVSIATGIITVAMLQEAPPTLTQTVNRVVEHTIERVVSGTSTPQVSLQPIVTNVTKEVTVYAKEDDLVVAAVEKNQPRIAKIYFTGAATSSDPAAIGFVISRDGLIVTEAKSIHGEGMIKDDYLVVIGDKQYLAKPMPGQGEGRQPVYFLKLEDLSASTTFDAVSFGRNDIPKLAQTVVVLGGADGTGVFKTTLSKLRYATSDSTTTQQRLFTGIETLPKIADQNTGALVVNLDGQTVGIVTPDPLDSAKNLIYPVSRILDLVGTLGMLAEPQTVNSGATLTAQEGLTAA